jgi:DNA-binding response OmpR family regulator
MDRVLLIAADWQFRALVRAQLLEEGFEVNAFPAPDVALAHLLRGGEPPQAIILDAEGVELEARLVSNLWQVAGKVPLLLCGGVSSRAALSQEGLPPARVVWRPLRVGDVVQAVREALSHP